MKVTKYTIDNDKIKNPFRIAMLSDLHMREYGEGNSELLKLVREQKPDIILIAGDMVNKTSTDISVAVNLFSELCKITDVYFCLGNHEGALNKKTGSVFIKLQETGAIYLDNRDVKIQMKGQEILIGGLSSNPDPLTPHYDFVTAFEKKEPFKILLCHYPEYFPNNLENYNLDLILSGHAHGGQVRIPGIGGIYAPEQGFLPEYTKGIYKSETATMLVGAGLGGASFLPRINNPPELVVIDVK